MYPVGWPAIRDHVDARVGRLVDRVLLVGDADVDRLGGRALGAARRVEGHPHDALVAGEVPVGVAGVLHVVAHVGEAGDLGPGDAGVGAPPQAVAALGAEVQDAVVVGVDLQPLAHAAAGHVAADLERQVRLRPGGAAVRRPQDRAVVRVPAVRVRADGGVHLVGVHRVGGQRQDAVVAPVVPADVVEQGDPALRRLVEPVRAADVGAGVHQTLLGLVVDDAGDEPAADDLDVAPAVGRVGGVGGLLAGEGDECTGDQGSGGGERREPCWCAGNERGGGHPRHSFVKAVGSSRRRCRELQGIDAGRRPPRPYRSASKMQEGANRLAGRGDARTPWSGRHRPRGGPGVHRGPGER